MTSLQVLSRLIGNIYDAALDSSLWDATLRDVLTVTGARAGHLLMIQPHGSRQNAVSVNFDAGESRKYDTHYSRLDPVAPLLEKTPVGHIVICRDVLSKRQTDGEFYRDWATPNEVGDALFVNIEHHGGDVCALVLGRPWLAKPFGTLPTLRTLQVLVPHFRRAMATRRALAASADRDFAVPALVQTHHGCVLLSAEGAVSFANDVAKQTAVRGEGLMLSSRGLEARLPREDAILQRLIKMAVSGGADHIRTGGRTTISRESGRKPLIVQTVPLTSHWLGEAFPGSTLVLIIDAERMAHLCRHALQVLYMLTPAEAAVAVRIPGSRGLQELANEMDLSLSTVRTHLQRAFEKTETHRQAELVRLLSELEIGGIECRPSRLVSRTGKKSREAGR